MSNQKFDLRRLCAALDEILGIPLPGAVDLAQARKGKAKLLRSIEDAMSRLAELERLVDGVVVPSEVFNLDPFTLGEVVAHRLRNMERVPLPSINEFYGSGVYCFYYHGDLSCYLAIKNSECPIYVGSSIPRVGFAETPKRQGTKLYDRITEHLEKSIKKSRNLKPEDFTCRFLVVQSGLEKAAEDMLIRHYLPVWNKETKVCSGIGKHGDQARKEKSKWDVLHGNRPWAAGSQSLQQATSEKIEKAIEEHFRQLVKDNAERWKRILNQEWLRTNSS